MKFSTKKERLKYADSVLATIREDIKLKKMNEIDWEKHRQWARGDVSRPHNQPKTVERMANLVREKKLKEIEEKYAKLPPELTSAEQKAQEIDAMLKEIELIRQHVLQSRVEIPQDPAKQTELQRAIVNYAPNLSGRALSKWVSEKVKEHPDNMYYKDPLTGLLWHHSIGSPESPSEWGVLLLKKMMETGEYRRAMELQGEKVGVGTAAKSLGLPEWDRSRGWLWNIMRQIFGMGDFSN